MTKTIRATDAVGTVDDVRLQLTDAVCECGNEWFQLTKPGDSGWLVICVTCCGCGDVLAWPEEEA